MILFDVITIVYSNMFLCFSVLLPWVLLVGELQASMKRKSHVKLEFELSMTNMVVHC